MTQLAQITRNLSYAAIFESLARRERAVLRCLLEHGPATDRELCGRLGWPINSVTGRRNDLAKKGLIVAVAKVYDRVTCRHVVRWSINAAGLAEYQQALPTGRQRRQRTQERQLALF